MSLWESVRGVFTPGRAPPISQDPEVGTLKPWNPRRRRMEFGWEDDIHESLSLEPTVPLHPEDLQGVLTEDQPGPESKSKKCKVLGVVLWVLLLVDPHIIFFCIMGMRYKVRVKKWLIIILSFLFFLSVSVLYYFF